MKGSKKRTRKKPGKLMAKSRSKPVNLPSARPSMNSLSLGVVGQMLWHRGVGDGGCRLRRC